ncbi:unnamed protein product [Trichogramma brassicae]|uniref:Uncharacterized protein n=1 Tax=Trichogramma brassicae TaxID=86971 RepID=A0A6H5IMQ0_9HYME|nr:unnamed protein product [Trichogramma brassicae]
MRAWSRSSIILAILCLNGLLAGSRAKLKKLTKHQNYLKNMIDSSKVAFYNTSVVHAQCLYETNWTSNNCTFHLDRYGFDDDPTRKLSCAVQLRASDVAEDQDQVVVTTDVGLVPFGSDKTIVHWTVKTEDHKAQVYRIAVLHFAEDCRLDYTSLDIPERSSAGHFITYDDKFEIVFWERVDASDSNLNIYKMSMDDRGKILSNAVTLFSNDKNNDVKYLQLVPLPVNSFSKSYLLIEQNYPDGTNGFGGRNSIVSLFGDDGTKLPLKSYPVILDQNKVEYVNPIYSTAHDLIGTCSRLDHQVSCAQYDLDGQAKFDVTLDFKRQLQEIAMLNLPAGGFLLLTVQCADPKCHGREHRYRVSRFDDKGAKVASLKDEKYPCSGLNRTTSARFFETELAGEYCVSLMCKEKYLYHVRRDRGEVFRLDAKCFGEKDLKPVQQANKGFFESVEEFFDGLFDSTTAGLFTR